MDTTIDNTIGKIRSTRHRWLTATCALAVVFAAGLWSGLAYGQAGETLRALTTFGSNGWLAPGSISYLTTNDTQRGLAWNPVTKNLILVSRTNTNVVGSSTNVVVLDGLTGTVTGTLSTTGVVGGNFAVNTAGVGDDGQVYVANLRSGATGTSATNFFKVYKWTTETSTSAPTLAFQVAVPFSQSGTNPNFATGWRFGDAFAVRGSGTATRFVVAGSSSGSSSGNLNNGNFMLGSLDGSNFNTIYRTISPGSSASSNGYRLGLTWVDDDTIIGLQGGPALTTDFIASGSGQTTSGATVTAQIVTGTSANFGNNTNLRQIDYLEMAGKKYAASIVTGTFGNGNRVEVYDISSGTQALLVAALNNTLSGTGVVANGNATGAVQFAEVTQPAPESPWYYETKLYAMNTNNGVQAMIFSVPEPSTWAMLATGAGLCGWAGRRRRLRSPGARIR